MPAVAAGLVAGAYVVDGRCSGLCRLSPGPGYEILPSDFIPGKSAFSPEGNALAIILLVLFLVMVIASRLLSPRDKTKYDKALNQGR